MKISFAHTLRDYKFKDISYDLITGIIIAAVSIPISMGYAQISGLPAVYGLYGSVFPIIIFSLFSTSKQMIFGVDAAPAALVGAVLLEFGIEGGSKEALAIVPVITFLVALWLLIFSLIKAGKLVSYISAPVMGGFITGICSEIILMQIPKLLGHDALTGELFELIHGIVLAFKAINWPSFILGVIALAIMTIGKKTLPKFPWAVLLMILGALITMVIPVYSLGIKTLSAVEPGLPKWSFPKFHEVPFADVITASLSITVVIMAETLLAENSFAQKNGYRVDNNQELFAFSIGNFLAAFTGCCPINGSVSRTAMSEQYKGKTQLVGIIAGISMAVLLIGGTGFIGFLPVPVLTAIVISALAGATEFELAVRLWKINRKECVIFIGAFLGVLILGTINGVLIGIILSFAEMIIRSSKPSRGFIGVQPGHSHFRNISGSDKVLPVKDVIIYRFSSSLFFANIDILVRDIEDSLLPNTKAVILDASGVGSIDITAADRLKTLYESLKQKNVKFYMTEHIAEVNDQLRNLGLAYMIEEGAVRRTIHVALKDMGINRPYPLDGDENASVKSPARKRLDNRIQEFTWAFGAETEQFLEKQVRIQIEKLKKSKDIEELIHGRWGYKEAYDEDEWLEHLEEHLEEIVSISGKDEETLLRIIEESREDIHSRIVAEKPEMEESFLKKRELLDHELQKKYPEIFEHIEELRNK